MRRGMLRSMDRRSFIKQSLTAAGGAALTGSHLSPALASPAPATAVRLPKDLIWGAATSSYQVEGAWREDGKGESIWDRFAHRPGTIRDGSNGDVACDQYHRYEEDIAILKKLNLKSYRFSTSWPRIQPEGTGAVNQRGLDYYRRLTDALVAAGIRPFCTIYHWDLPQALEDRGGWPNRDLAGYFADFAAILAKNLGDRITVWAPFNMPGTFTWRGYGVGDHPPCRKDLALGLKAAHTVNLAQGMAFRAIKAASSKATVGSAYGMEPVYPKTDSEADKTAAARFHAFHNTFFLDTAMRGEYPRAFAGDTPLDAMGFKPGDEVTMKVPLDWLGIHYYLRLLVSDSGRESASPIDPMSRIRVEGGSGPKNDGGWEVFPQGFYDLLMQVTRDYHHPIIEITETGAAYNDGPDAAGRIHDERRIAFYREHLKQLARALTDGARVRAYHAWTLLDNFEWSSGYSARMGLTYVDFKTQQRTIKDSGLWYAKVAATGQVED